MRVIQVGIGGMGSVWLRAVQQSPHVTHAAYVEIDAVIAEQQEKSSMRKLAYLSLLALLGCLPHIHQSDTLDDLSVLQLAFETNLPHNDICIINADGTEQRCLMQTDEARDYNPIWSPDGRFIAFHSIEESVGVTVPTTYIYDLEHRTIIHLPQVERVFDWSHNGDLLLVAGLDSENRNEIYTVQSDGTTLQQLTDTGGINFNAQWSPDGSHIAYLSGFPQTNLMLITASGKNPLTLTADLQINPEVQPQWSPDGNAIAFVVNGEMVGTDQTSEIYVIQSDGSNLRQLTDSGGVNLNPRWSPDGTQLVFYGYAVGAFDDISDPDSLRTDVFLINADGTNLLNLTQSTGLDYHPDWSLDGKWIAFASTRDNPGIFIIRSDGSDLQMVTNEPPMSEGGREANNPVWRPVHQPRAVADEERPRLGHREVEHRLRCRDRTRQASTPQAIAQIRSSTASQTLSWVRHIGTGM